MYQQARRFVKTKISIFYGVPGIHALREETGKRYNVAVAVTARS